MNPCWPISHSISHTHTSLTMCFLRIVFSRVIIQTVSWLSLPIFRTKRKLALPGDSLSKGASGSLAYFLFGTERGKNTMYQDLFLKEYIPSCGLLALHKTGTRSKAWVEVGTPLPRERNGSCAKVNLLVGVPHTNGGCLRKGEEQELICCSAHILFSWSLSYLQSVSLRL